MRVLPAIDIMDGKVVRLLRGDFDKSKQYSDDPIAVAKDFVQQGADFLHIVDLSGARDESAGISEIVPDLISLGADIELGGGIRSMDQIKKLLEIGVKRVIIGTKAVSNPEFVADAVKAFGPKCIVVALDVDGGYVKVKGWQENSGTTLNELLSVFSPLKITVLITDISKDGMLEGIDVDFYADIAAKYDGDVIASGGVSSLADIEALAELARRYPNIDGVVVGKAIYEGVFTVKEAVEACLQRG